MIRYLFLDGLRGLAAMWVVLYHIRAVYQKEFSGLEMVHGWTGAFLRHGDMGVPVFILLSGFCLMLPIVRSRSGMLRGGLRLYVKRRALRILPAYYAAIVLGVVSTYLAQFAKARLGIGSSADALDDVTRFDVLVSHLALVHNLFEPLNQTLNPVMWSVAAEWQIYFIFALILLPVWRLSSARFGIVASAALTLLTAILIGYAPLLLLPAQYNLSWTKPWFVGVFCLGMLGAVVSEDEHPMMQNLMQKMHWGIGALVPLGAFCLCNGLSAWREWGINDWATGLATLCLILNCIRSSRRKVPHTQPRCSMSQLVFSLFETRVLLFLGTISYSLYLTHFLVLFRLGAFLSAHHVSKPVWCISMFLLGGTCAIVLAFVFYLLFEKPFITLRSKAGAAVLNNVTTK